MAELLTPEQKGHLSALQARGLRVDYEGQVFQHRLSVYNHASLVEQHQPDDFDLIAIALKSTAAQAVMAELGAAASTAGSRLQ